MGSTPHTHCATDARVEIVLKSGEVIFGRFRENRGKFVELRGGRRVAAGQIRSFRVIRAHEQAQSRRNP